MKRLGGIVALWLMLLLSVAYSQTLLTTSPVLIGTSTSLVITAARFNETNVTLTANTPIKIATPLISDTMTFRLRICENSVGGFTPTFTAVTQGLSIVNNVGGLGIQQTGANYCEVQNWSYRSRQSQLVLESVSPPTGGIPGVTVTNTPLNGQALQATGTNTASWATITGTLPGGANTGTLLFGSGAGAIFQGFANGSDLFASATVPGVVTLNLGTITCTTNCTINRTSAVCNSAAGPVTMLLPPAQTGLVVHAKSATTSTNTCTLAAQGIDLIDGATTVSMPNAKDDVLLVGLASGVWGLAAFNYPVAQPAQPNQFVTGLTNGVVSTAQPACSNLTGAAAHCGTNASELASGTIPTAQLPNPLPAANIPAPTISTLGGVNSIAAVSHKFVNSIGTNGTPTAAQPASTDLSDLPIPVSSGGTNHTAAGAATANAIGAAASGANSDITSLAGMTTALPLSEGGRQCGGPTIFASLPASPTTGEICFVTDPSGCTCQVGTAVVNGGGSSCTVCEVTYNGSATCGNGSQNCWMPAGNASAAGGAQVPINQLPSQTARYSANNQPIGTLPAPALAGDALSEGHAIGAVSAAAVTGTTVTGSNFTSSTANPSTAGLLNDVNNHQTVAARNAANTLDIPEIKTDSSNVVHIGGTNAASISLDNALTSALAAGSGGTGVASPTAHGVPIAEGTSAFNLVALINDQLLLGATGADPAPVSLLNCGDATHALAYSTASHTFSCQAITATASAGGTTGQINYNNAGAFAGFGGTGLVKSNVPSAPTIAVAGTDYQAPIAGNTLAAHNFANSINTAGTIAGARPASTDLSDLPIPASSGGSGVTSPTAFGLLYGNGSSAFGSLVLTNDQLLQGVSGAAPQAVALVNCGSSTQALAYSTTSHTFSCQTISATASAGGTNGAIQYNNAGALGGVVITGLVLGNGASAPSAYGGSGPLTSHQFGTTISAAGVLTGAQPAFTDISGSIATSQVNSGTGASATTFFRGDNTWSQPAFSGITGTVAAAQLPNPSASTLGGIESFQLVTHQWISSISTSGVPSATRPASTDLSDLPIPVSSGGTQCSGAGTFASVISALVSPPTGTICTVTDAAQTCSAGTQITSGTGTPATPYCEVINVGTSGSPLWYAAGVGVAGAGSGSNYGTKVGLTAQTSITATCSTISSTHFARDMVWEVLTGNTTYTTPASGAGCIDGSRIEAYFIQGDNQAYQVTLADGAGTNHTGGGFVTVPTSTGTGQGYFLHVELEYHTNNTQWELKPQITNPLGGSGTATLNYGLALFTNSGVTTSSVCLGRDITNPSATIAFDGYTAGQVTVHGPSTGNPGDVVQIACQAGGGGAGGSGTTAGFSNSPTVTISGGNATTTLTGQCLSAGCSDFQTISNSSNSGTMTITPENPVSGAGMTPFQYIFVYVTATGTAPSDVLFASQSGVTYQSDQPGLSATNLTSTSAAAKLARANSCGSPPATGQLQYNFIWDGTNLTLTGCSSTVTSPFISPALVGGAQWATRATANGPGTDPVLATDTVIEDNTTGGNWTETLPACTSSNIGKFYKFKNVGTGNGSIILTPNGADTIDALSSVTVSGSYAEYTIRCSSTSGVWRRELPLPWTHSFGGTDVTSAGTNGQLLTSNGTNFVVASAPRPVGFTFPGTITNSQIVSIPCTGTWNFPASLGGAQTFPDATAQATCDGAGPSGSADDFTISVCTGSGNTISCTQKADVSLAATTCVPTFNANAAFACNSGNTLQIAAPGTTHSEVNVGITLQGHTP